MERTDAMTAATAPLTERDGSILNWPAVIAGGVVATAIGLMFAGFGAAVGIGAIDPIAGETGAGWTITIVAAWLLITTILAYGAGGYIAGRMRPRMDAASADEVAARDSIHGAVVWALGVLLSVWLAAGAIGAASSAVGTIVGGAASAAGAVAEGAAAAGSAVADSDMVDGLVPDNMMQRIDPLEIINQRMLRGTGERISRSPTLPANGKAILAEAVRTGEINEDDRAYLIDIVTTNSTLTESDVEARVDQAMAEVTELREEAAAMAETVKQEAIDAAEAAQRASVISGFVVTVTFLIAAAAAIWGSAIGGRHRDEGLLFGGFRSF